jgi:protein YibB
MHDITIVTAFFDIKRGSYKTSTRATATYIEWFKRWARIKNKLIVFCGSNEIETAIEQIRKDYNLLDKTTVVVIDNIFEVESDMYKRMTEIEKDKYFLDFRLEKELPENKADYNYINFMKTYFLYKAVAEYNISTEWTAWLDFGFDHGGKTYPHEEDWNFLWQCELKQKIHLFYLPPKLEERPLFEVIRTTHPDSISGGIIICPTVLAKRFWELVRESIYILLYVGLMDDDQPVLLLTSRREPDIFELTQSDWFLPLKLCGGAHMRTRTIRQNTETISFTKRIIRKIIRIIKRSYNSFKKVNTRRKF